ncbi:MAG: sensor histidine kinase, partial [Candidatus Izimaplasma sp.]|nr:sensor histidine kinase [Candidatus Izimaplasma bacterium]
ETDDKAYFELTNYGININDHDLENIWIPFFRTSQDETQRLKTRGTGIGLYLVSEILKAHKCKFGIENVENGVKAFFYINKKVE